MDTKYKKIHKKMIDAKETCWKRYASDRVRCPSLKVMADYINNVFKDYKAVVEQTSCSKGRQMRSGVYYSLGNYSGNKLIVRKDNKIVLEHDATQTYRYNVEVARWILDERKKNNG